MPPELVDEVCALVHKKTLNKASSPLRGRSTGRMSVLNARGRLAACDAQSDVSDASDAPATATTYGRAPCAAPAATEAAAETAAETAAAEPTEAFMGVDLSSASVDEVAMMIEKALREAKTRRSF